IILAATAVLAACGGSSSGSFDGGGSASMSITVESGEVPTNSSMQVTVRFRAADASAAADGTQGTLKARHSHRGGAQAVGAGESARGAGSAAAAGGHAQAIFTRRSAAGRVTLTASGPTASGAGRVPVSRDVGVVEDPVAQGRLTISGA